MNTPGVILMGLMSILCVLDLDGKLRSQMCDKCVYAMFTCSMRDVMYAMRGVACACACATMRCVCVRVRA
jgi:hypothetical protein